MAFLNLLNGSFKGKLGSVSGTKVHGVSVVRAVPFSKAPASEAQSGSFVAFYSLNRIASKISSLFWNYLNLSDKKMLRHNAVSSWLSPCIADHVFDPYLISSVIGTERACIDISLSVSAEDGKATLFVERNSVPPASWLVLLFDDSGKVFMSELPSDAILSKDIFSVFSINRTYYLMSIRADFMDGKSVVAGFSITSSFT
jgi:hypothetical protein